MTPIEHGLIGYSLAALAEHGLPGEKTRLSRAALYSCFIVASLLPDVDVISALKPGYYNNQINNIFLSHRGITHTLLAVTFFAALIAGLHYLKNLRPELFMPAFWISLLAGTVHLVCDLPNPSTPWGGIPVFFPLRAGGNWWRIGGWDKIGWYDYRIMFTLLSAFILTMPFIRKNINSKIRKIAVITVHTLALLMVIGIVAFSEYPRGKDFDTAEYIWLRIQYETMPDFLVDLMERAKWGLIGLLR